MTRSAVVGVDPSLSARLALEHAAQRVGPDRRLVLVHAIGPLPPASSWSGSPPTSTSPRRSRS